LNEKEIEVCVGEEAGEATHLYCRFTLTRDDLPPLREWVRFVAALCKRFQLGLRADGVAPCSGTEFEAAVRRNRNWRRFADSLGWDRF
jgi:hypothetical protein